jgi:tape measure domain-containing protein
MGYTTGQGAVISVSVDGAAASQRQIDNIAQSMGNLSNIAQNAMRSLAATAGIGGGLVQVVQLSDEYTKFTAQLRLATQSQGEYQAALEGVRRIAHDTQAELSSVGVLYARISNGTRELGLAQKQVADITEVVNLALKVSGATTEEAASAQLQLSQSFASGTLRGEEFNAVNEAAPRLMKALADGIGVPVGALKQMATEGKITSEVMAAVLPKSLEQLRQEAQQVQTIGGAFTNLKNQVLEYTATTAQANGTVAVLSGGINLLSDNLQLLAGTLTTVTAVKAANWASEWVTAAYNKIAADQASRAATLAAAEADLARVQATAVQATATQAAIVVAREEAVARLTQANSNILAARAAFEAAAAAGAQSFALRTLRLATGELQVAEAARSSMLAELAVLGQQQVRISAEIAAARAAEAAATTAANAAQGAGAVATGVASRAMGLLGGPVGAIVTLLGLAATAWSVYGSKSAEANKQAAESVEASTPEIVANLEKQNVKLRERLSLMKQGMPELAKDSSPQADRIKSILGEINALSAKYKQLKDQGQELDAADQAQLYALGLQYSNLTQAAQANKDLKAEIDASGTALTDLIAVRERLSGVDKQYFEDLGKLEKAREKGAISEKEYIALVSQLATETYKKSEAGKEATSSANKEKEAYATLISSIREKIDANRLELAAGENATDSQKTQVKLDEELATGKLKLSAAHQAVARAAIASLAVSEQAIKLSAAERDVAKYIIASTEARNAAAAALDVEYALYGKSADVREIAMVAVRAQADQEKKLAEMREAKKPVSDQMLAQLTAETKARILVEQATLAQGKALGYAAQLAEENKRFGLDYIADDKARAAATLALDAQVWRERIANAGEGTEAQRRLQQEFDTWYLNQSVKPQLDAQKKMWDDVESAAHDTFISIENGAKSAADRAKQALENGLFEWLWQMAAKPIYMDIRTAFTGGGPSLAGAVDGASAATGSAASNPLIGAASAASAAYKAVSLGFDGLSDVVAGSVQSAMTSMGYTPLASQGLATASGQALTPLASTAGTVAGYGAGMLAGHYIGNAIAGDYSVNHGQAVTNTATIVGAIVGGPIGAAIGGAIGGLANRAFGHGSTEIESQGYRGTLSASNLSGESYQNLHQDGGWFTSDRDWPEVKAFTDNLRKQFTEGLSAIEVASSSFASSLGVSADWVKDYSKTFNIALTGDATKDQQAVTDFFIDIGDEIASKLVPNLDSLSKSGETASAALERLAGDFKGTDQVAQLLGFSADKLFGSAGLQSATAREQLIDMAGGLSALNQQAAFFNQNFLTDAERIAPVSAALDKALASLGLATIPTTRDEFKTLVNCLIESGAAATETGAKQLDSLLALGEAFAQVHPQIDAAADAVGKAADAMQAMKDAASTLTGDVDSAFSVLQRVVAREKAALQDRITAETALIGKTKALSDSLHGALDGMRAVGQENADRSAAQAQIKAALAIARAGGPLPDADSLKSALSTVSQSQGDFATYQDYLRDFYSTQNDIASLAQASDGTLSAEQQTLDTLNAQSKQYDDMLAREQEQLDQLKGQSTSLLSIDQALQGVSTAILAVKGNPLASSTVAINNAYQSALGRAPDAAGLAYWQNAVSSGESTAAVVNSITGSPEAQVQSLYHSLLGRTADAAGLSYWLHSGESMDAIAADIKGSAEYRTLHPFAIGADYIPEDMPALVHQGERIIPAADNRELMRRLASPSANNDALAAEIRALRATVALLLHPLDRIDNSTKQHAAQFDKVSGGGNLLAVETV